MYRFLALGDSYTIGEGVKRQDSWPYQLQRTCHDHELHFSNLQVLARTGWTTDELHEAILQENMDHHFDLVTLQIGVNDQYRGYPLNRFQNTYVKLLDLAQTFAGGKAQQVLAVSIPDWSVTPFANGRDKLRISKDINSYNQAAQALSAAQELPWIDVTEISRALGGQPEMLVADELHPSAFQYEEWVNVLCPSILNIFDPGKQ